MESVADRDRDGGFRVADFSSVKTRSSVRRGRRSCWRCTAAPGFDITWDEVTALRTVGRAGEGVFSPPSFRQSAVDVSGRRAE